MFKYIKLLVVLVIFPFAANSQSMLKKQGYEKLVLENVNVVDVINKQIKEGVSIVIKNGVIEEITKEKFVVSGKVKVINLLGKYVIPGLIDAHVHLSNDIKETRKDRVKHLNYYLKGGITTVRDCAGDTRILASLQRAVITKEINGPDIYYSAFMAGESYYDGNDREANTVIGWGKKYSPWLQCLKQDSDLDKAMIEAKAVGATGIKIYAGFDKKYLIKIVAKAKKYGLKIWGHSTLFPAKPSDVVSAGVEVISHSYMLRWEQIPLLENGMMKSFDKYFDQIDVKNAKLDKLFRLMKEKNCIFDVTQYLCNVNGMEWSNNFVEQAYKAGVKISAGTDYINDFKRNLPFLYDELDLYVKECNMKPIDAIRSATIIAAEVLGLEKRYGSIDKGKIANLVVLDANPIKNIDNLRMLSVVIKNGEFLK